VAAGRGAAGRGGRAPPGGGGARAAARGGQLGTGARRDSRLAQGGRRPRKSSACSTTWTGRARRRVSHFDALWERIGIAVRHAGDKDFLRFFRVEVSFAEMGTLYRLLDNHEIAERTEGYDEQGISIDGMIASHRLESFQAMLKNATRDRFRLQRIDAALGSFAKSGCRTRNPV